MGEERDDPQKLKKIAAAAYDYNDPRWADYWANILIPPHMASSPDVISHFKQKFYKRYIDPELLVDAMFGSNPPPPPKRPSASSRSTNDSAGSTARTSGTIAASETSGSSATSAPTSLR